MIGSEFQNTKLISILRLAITGDGVYSLHGAKGLGKPWTKLSATASKGATTISVVDEVFT
jgi:hypothetical protein